MIRKLVIATGDITTFAGQGSGSFTDSVGTKARFNGPMELGISVDGHFALLADHHNHRNHQR